MAPKGRGQDKLPCIIGTPLPGERAGLQVFDGSKPVAVFPGDLPADASAALDGRMPHSGDGAVRAIRFRPPRIEADGPTGKPAPWPHIRLDRALEFLIGDRLA